MRGSEGPEGRKRGLDSWGLVGCEGCEGVSRAPCSMKGWGGNLCSFLVADFLSKIIT